MPPIRLFSASTLLGRQSSGIGRAFISASRAPLFAFSGPATLTKATPVLSSRLFSSTSSAFSSNNSSTMSPSTQALLEAVKARRSFYFLGRNAPVSDAETVEVINQIMLHCPSSFNTQSTRVIVAFHDEHEKVWDIITDAFKPLVASGAVPEELFKNQTKPKLDGFKGAYGTVLFYEDPAHLKPYAEKFPPFADKFPEWAGHTNAMHQYLVWTALETLGFGANLQHYNPLPDAALAKAFDVPSEWQLVAQLVFGSIEKPANEKTFKPLEERVKVLGAK